MRVAPSPQIPTLRKPTVQDVEAIMLLIEPEVLSERLLPRTTRQVTERLRDYTVAVEDDRIVGVASVSLVDLHLAEIGVLSGERPEVEQALIDAVLAEAETMGVGRSFVLTDDASRFEALGFTRTTMASLPEKRDRQCQRCTRLPRCRQVALERALQPVPLRASA